MQSKKIKGRGVALTVLITVGAYALLACLAAVLCLNEAVEREAMGGVYFALGLCAVFAGGLAGGKTSGLPRIYAGLTALAALLLAVMAGRSGGGASEGAVWIYPGAVCGGIAVLFVGGHKKRSPKRSGGVRRKR